MIGDVAILGPVPNAKHCANYISILIVTSSSRAQLVQDRKGGIIDGFLEHCTLLELKWLMGFSSLMSMMSFLLSTLARMSCTYLIFNRFEHHIDEALPAKIKIEA